MTHSPEPWRIEGPDYNRRIADANGKIVADPVANDDGMEDVDRERIVACVNACRGIDNEDLSRLKRFIIMGFIGELARTLGSTSVTIAGLNDDDLNACIERCSQ